VSAASTSQCENHSDSQLVDDQPGDRGSQTVLTVAVAAADAGKDDDFTNSEEFRLDVDMMDWWKDDVSVDCSPRCCSVDSELSIADEHQQSSIVEPSCRQSPSPQRCQTVPDSNVDEELAATDSDCDHSDDDNGDNATEDSISVMISEHAVAEQSNPMSIHSRAGSTHCEQFLTCKLQFHKDKLCLLEKMIAGGNTDFPCTMRVIMAENAVELLASEENITGSKIKLYELIANFSSISLDLPVGIVKLMSSNRGQRWLQTHLASLNAVFYVGDGTIPFVVAADTQTSMDAKYLLANTLSFRKILFDDQHVTFLKSAQWAESVNKFESEYIVAVRTEYRENEIVVEGVSEAVKDVVKSVEMMLSHNSRVQRHIVMSAQQFRLLVHFKDDIHDKLISQQQENRCLQLLLIYNSIIISRLLKS